MPQHITHNGRGMGWRPPRPTHVYRPMFSAPLLRGAISPKSDLQSGFGPVWDQQTAGSCVGHGCAGGLQFATIKLGQADATQTPSRLMLYWLARYLEGSTGYDAGASVADGVEAAEKWGTCYEDGPDNWPYDISKLTDRPPDACFAMATKDRAIQAYQVTNDLAHLRACLSDGWPVVFGFTCYPELDSPDVANTGVVPMPRQNEREIGGHCVVLAGHDDSERLFKFRNSWSERWGRSGYGFLPYEYVARLASDFHTIRLVT